jgi:hypothetical protein
MNVSNSPACGEDAAAAHHSARSDRRRRDVDGTGGTGLGEEAEEKDTHGYGRVTDGMQACSAVSRQPIRHRDPQSAGRPSHAAIASPEGAAARSDEVDDYNVMMHLDRAKRAQPTASVGAWVEHASSKGCSFHWWPMTPGTHRRDTAWRASRRPAVRVGEVQAAPDVAVGLFLVVDNAAVVPEEVVGAVVEVVGAMEVMSAAMEVERMMEVVGTAADAVARNVGEVAETVVDVWGPDMLCTAVDVLGPGPGPQQSASMLKRNELPVQSAPMFESSRQHAGVKTVNLTI